MTPDKAPQEFAALWSAASALLSPERGALGRGNLIVLSGGLRPVSEHIERGEVFKGFASYLKSSGMKLEDWKIARILQRSGFYQAIQQSGSPEIVWQTFRTRLPPRTASVRTLILLDGCRFPLDRFTLLDRTVQRFSEREVRELGPPPDIAETFFPNEVVDSKWFSQQWFLHWSETREEKSGSVWIWPFGYDVISTSWQPLLALALYKVFPFAAPIVLETQSGWELRRVSWSDPWFDLLDADGEAVEAPTGAVNGIETPRLQ